jgi:hypothetical protein
MPQEKADPAPVLRNGTGDSRHRFQPFREFIPPRSRDEQPFLRPGHAEVEEFYVLGGLGFRGFDLAEADEEKRLKPRTRGSYGTVSKSN